MRTANIIAMDGTVYEYHEITRTSHIAWIKDNAQRIRDQGFDCIIEWYDDEDLVATEYFGSLSKAG